MPNQELHQKTVEVLQKIAGYISEEELYLLLWHCGMSENDLLTSEPTATQKSIPIAEL